VSRTRVAGGTDASGSVTELPDGNPNQNITVHTDSGAVAFADVDLIDTHSASFTPQGAFYLGTFSLDPVDQIGDSVGWDFTVSDAALDGLSEGEIRIQTYAVQVNDGNGGTATQNVTITITGAGAGVGPQTVWFIDNTAVGSTNVGTSANPYTSIAAFNAAQGSLGGPQTGHTVHLRAGTGTGIYAEADGINLLNGQILVGDANGAVRPKITTTAGDGINVAQNNNISGIDIGNTSGADIADSGGTVGNLTITDVGSSGTGQIIDVDQGGTLNVTLNSAQSLGSSGGAIDLNLVGGSFTVNGATTISGIQSGGGVDITNSSLNASLSGGGAITTTSTRAINYVGNSGSLTLDGGFVIATTTGNGINASGGGTLTVIGSGNTIASAGGIALNVLNTTIGAGGLTFQSISASGGAAGIVLTNTGSSGGLSVTGVGSTAGSGGTIQNTQQGAVLTSTSNVSLSNMNFTNANTSNGVVNNADNATFNSGARAAINLSNVSTATFTNLNMNGGVQVGINGQNVSNLTIADSTITGFGDSVGEGDVKLWNLSGTASVTNSTFSFAAGDSSAGENLFEVRNNGGTLILNASGNTFSNTRDSANGSGGIALTAVSSAVITLNATNNDFLNLATSGIETIARGTSTMSVNITDGGTVGNGNVFDPQGGTGRAIGLSAEDSSALTFNINDNAQIYGNGGPTIAIVGIDDAQVMGRIEDNGDIRGGGAGSVGSPVLVDSQGSAEVIVSVARNTISEVGFDPGIMGSSSGDGVLLDATLDIIIADNDITLAVSGFGVGIWVSSGANAGDVTVTAAYVHDNVVNLDPMTDYAFVTREGSDTSNLYFQGFVAGADNQAIAENTWAGNGNISTGMIIAVDSGAPQPYAPVPAAAPYFGVVRTPTNPLLAGIQAPEGSEVSALSQGALDLVVGAAIDRWAAAGASGDQLAAMRSVVFDIVDLRGAYLGQSGDGHITIDSDAAGHGWFVDTMSGDYGGSTDGMDLLTVVMHELGHQIGLDDHYLDFEADELMFGMLSPGDRHLPGNMFEETGFGGPGDLGGWGHSQLPGPQLLPDRFEMPIHHLDIPGV